MRHYRRSPGSRRNIKIARKVEKIDHRHMISYLLQYYPEEYDNWIFRHRVSSNISTGNIWLRTIYFNSDKIDKRMICIKSNDPQLLSLRNYVRKRRR